MTDPNLEETGLYEPDESGMDAFQTAAALPRQIGRYRIVSVLAQGGFGRVFLAHDDELNRPVAIKVPRRDRIDCPEDAQEYLAEARTVASLDHPNIVPVHDVGTTPDGLCYVVSKLIPGDDLAKKIRQARPSFRDSAELIATVAEALHHAHKRGLVHRDIKPANLLIDSHEKPYVADFGLALKEEDFGRGAKFAGTPAYMSPEQARGEGHRVDGRSDIFSLGVVFYELLAGRRPFKADSQQELLEQITSVEARPPRQIEDQIPKELERICLKALSKRATERYSTAKDMAEDLWHFLARQPAPVTAGTSLPSTTAVVQPPLTLEGLGTTATAPTPTSDSRPIRIVPKGLRSFDAHDADFFLELLPGPRDRDGLPDSIRFWKTRIEELDADSTFSVGLIYGPSGCGKSSLVKAGLIPRLGDQVIVVYVEATADETETRLLNGLRKRCPELPGNLGLTESLAALRREQGIPLGNKVVIILDQFEQWLHAKKEEQDAELVHALRQCDGGRVQCIVMVRDDFWMAATRFMRELEVRLVEAQNSVAVDLFDLDHARRVLAAFGRAFGKLPSTSGEMTKEQKEFLKHAVSGLAQEGKVISVRLALFAEMMKGKAWTHATLKEAGGTEGVGVTFLEETFSATTAPPEHRYHQKAARAVLKALLPESGTDIKGHMRSYDGLLTASGYDKRPQDFEDLIRILDGEVRLITPTDPDGNAGAEESTVQPPSGEKHYQLTHDYLVPSLRDWLTRKQKETRRGRAELLLADRATVWNTRRENRQLPSLVQWAQIRWLTQKQNWTDPQRKMMRRAGRHHAVRALVFTSLLLMGTFIGLGIQQRVIDQRRATEAAGLVKSVLNADTAQVPAIISQMSELRHWTDPLLRVESTKAGMDSRQKLHASLALLPVDATQVDYLYGRLLEAAPHEVPVVRDALVPHKDEFASRLWGIVQSPAKGKESQRLRAAAALATYAPDSDGWAKSSRLVVNDLVAENPVFLGQWSEAFRPVKNSFLAALADIFRDQRPERTGERNLATNLLADYVADQPQFLADLLMDSDEKQFAVIFPKFQGQSEQGLPVLTGELDRKLSPDLPSSDESRETLAKRQANAAVALVRMNQPQKVWPLLQHTTDPRVRSYLIHRLYPFGVDAGTVIKRLDEEPDVTIRRALLLSLGEYGDRHGLEPAARSTLTARLQELYRTADDAGLHAAVEWLLRTWKQEAWLKEVNDEWAQNKEQRGQRLANVQTSLDAVRASPQWYVNGQGQTLVVIPGPVEFVMGSPSAEAGRREDESQHTKRIGRTFALAAKSVTVEQYRQFDKGYELPEKYTRLADLPVVGMSWYQAVAYCNWLSKAEGIDEDQWCYEIAGDETKLKANSLSLTGYRLPTESEMEYATRAGALTSRYYGETGELLSRYAWYLQNSQELTWPVGSLKPNDFGLFDVQGNVFTWCQDRYENYPVATEVVEDKEGNLVIVRTDGRVWRGGSFLVRASFVRSANRVNNVPAIRSNYIGFRVARTLPPIPLTTLPLTPSGGRI